MGFVAAEAGVVGDNPGRGTIGGGLGGSPWGSVSPQLTLHSLTCYEELVTFLQQSIHQV